MCYAVVLPGPLLAVDHVQKNINYGFTYLRNVDTNGTLIEYSNDDWAGVTKDYISITVTSSW